MISIIVPVYNTRDFVGECLESLAVQTLDDYEIIVVDDGSTDGSGEIVDKFCAPRGRFHALHKPNGGLMSAWKYGVERASGDYLGFVDSDDYVAPEMFEKMYSAAKENSVDIVMCGRTSVKEDGKLLGAYRTESPGPGIWRGCQMDSIWHRAFPSILGDCISNARWNKVFRAEVFRKNLPYCACDSRTFEDRYIVPASMLTAQSFQYIDEPLYVYRSRSGSNSGMPKPELLVDIKRMNHVQERMLRDKGLFDEFRLDWEHARLDSVRCFVTRNVMGYGSSSMALASARLLIADEEYCPLILKYADELVSSGNMGRALVLAAKHKAPFALFAVARACSRVERMTK